MSCSVEKQDAVGAPETVQAERPFVRPQYRTSRQDDGYRAEVVMPGVAKSGVVASVEDGVLVVTGTRSDTVPESWRALRVELQKPDYRLKLKLNDEIDANAIKASVDSGVLVLELPIREAVKPRLIAVN